MKIEVSNVAKKQILTTAKKRGISQPVLMIKSSCKDYCCGPPLFEVDIQENCIVDKKMQLVGRAVNTPVYLENEILPKGKRARLIVNALGPKKELAAVLVVS